MTVWLNQLKQGDQTAAKKLWDRYGPTLIQLARRRYHSVSGPVFDEEDLVQNVFSALWTAATSGRLKNVQSRDELWWLLLTITRRKAISRIEHDTRQKRPGKKVVPYLTSSDTSDLSPFEPLTPDPKQPPPDLILVLDEEKCRLLDLLQDDMLRTIALLKLDGYTHEEIAKQLGVTPRTIVRKCNLIRECWTEELACE